jgi:hypothetical protein
MSTEKWESITWDWLEREIADYLLIAGGRRDKSGSLVDLLVQRSKARVDSAAVKPERTQERNDG